MKLYHYLITVGLCLWFIGSCFYAGTISELLDNFLIFIVSIVVTLIAVFLDDYEDRIP